MDVIYVSCACSIKKFDELFSNSKNIPGQQVQKYNRLLMEGLVLNNVRVQSVTALPITRKNHYKKFIKSETNTDNGVIYNYLSTINLFIIKNISIFISSFFKTVELVKKNTIFVNLLIFC